MQIPEQTTPIIQKWLDYPKPESSAGANASIDVSEFGKEFNQILNFINSQIKEYNEKTKSSNPKAQTFEQLSFSAQGDFFQRLQVESTNQKAIQIIKLLAVRLAEAASAIFQSSNILVGQDLSTENKARVEFEINAAASFFTGLQSAVCLDGALQRVNSFAENRFSKDFLSARKLSHWHRNSMLQQIMTANNQSSQILIPELFEVHSDPFLTLAFLPLEKVDDSYAISVQSKVGIDPALSLFINSGEIVENLIKDKIF